MRRVISILAAVIVLATMSGTGIFAAEGMKTTEEPAVTVTDEIDETAAPAKGEPAAGESTPAEGETPGETTPSEETQTEPAVTFTVTFDSAGGSAVDAQTVESGQPATKPADPTMDGYTFMGWQLNGADYDFTAPVTADITLTAVWEVKTEVTVTFKSKGGSDVAAVTVPVGEKVAKPKNPTKKNCKFVGWMTDPELASDPDKHKEYPLFNFAKTPVTEDLTLYALWNKPPKSPRNVQTLSGRYKITVKWKKVKGANFYRVYKRVSGTKSWGKPIILSGAKKKYVDRKVEMYKKYDYAVVSVKRMDGMTGKKARVTKTFSKAVAKTKETVITQMYITVTLKSGCSLTSHDSASKTRYFSGGTKLRTTGWDGYGKYIFYYGGNKYYVQRIRCRNATATVNSSRSDEYTREEAEKFVNSIGITSQTKALIWVNQYNQHLYVFHGSKGKWKCVKDNEVSTGLPSTPTATGKHKIYIRWGMHHGIPKWNVYKGGAQAIHGTYSAWRKLIGGLASGGCIRNYNENIDWIYSSSNVPMYSAVYIY